MGKFIQLVVRNIFIFCSCLVLSNIIHAAPFSATVTDYAPLELADTQDDDTHAVQEAISEAQLHGGIVFFPAGTYNVKNLKVDSSVTFMGEGAGSVIKQLDSESEKRNILDIVLKKDWVRVYIDLLTFDGNNNNVHPNNVIIKVEAEGTGQSNVALEVARSMFVNQAYASVMFHASVEDIGDEYLKVRDCVFQRGNSGSINYDPRYIEVYRGAQIVITDNLFDFENIFDLFDYPVSISAIIIAASTDDEERNLFSSAIIKGNVFRGLGRDPSSLSGTSNEFMGLGVIDFYRRGDNIIISDNIFENSWYTAVRGKSDVRRLLVANNLIDKADGLGVHITRIHKNILNSGEIIIEGNIIKEVLGGIWVIGNGGREDNTDDVDWLWNVSIRGNIIARALDKEYWGHGIRVRRLFSFDILHNRISDTERHGIKVDWSIGSGDISQNMVFNSKQDGIRVEPPSEGKELRINFLGNHIEDTKDTGITARKITVANIQGNHIHKARRAIDLYSISHFAKVNDNIATNVGTYLSKFPSFQTVDESDNSWR